MCTSIAWDNGNLFIGRNMDISFDFDRQVVVVPRNYEFVFKQEQSIKNHYAIIGTASVVENYPLFAEAVNEKGLYMAGLNFPGIAHFYNSEKNKQNITVNELIPYVLSKCENIAQVSEILKNINITNIPFIKGLPIPELHFIVSHKTGSIVIECTKEKMHVHLNPTGILTNNPPIEIQLHNLNNYMSLSAKNPKNSMTKEIKLNNYCMGLGALGLPGDFSSQSRFVKAYFLKTNSITGKTEEESVAHMFHMLDNVCMVKGAVLDNNDAVDYTVYSCCINADKGIYYYKTYNSTCIQAVSLQNENLEDSNLKCYKHENNAYIHYINANN